MDIWPEKIEIVTGREESSLGDTRMILGLSAKSSELQLDIYLREVRVESEIKFW